MNILVTNHRLHGRAGVQSSLRDLTRGLQALGHSCMAYTSAADTQRLLENDLTPVVTDLERLTVKPDIIHAHNHLDLMAALTALPDVPAIYNAHGATWRDGPPLHPRVYRYVAVSRTLANRMMVEGNIPAERVSVISNGIDFARFSQVRALPEKPARALFYNSRITAESETVEAVREAAQRAGLELSLVGYHFSSRTEKPERLLPEYDIVFASGLSAIEALACGCAVIVLGRTSCGEMVLPENYDHLRAVNFSIAVNSAPPSAERILTQLARYSPARCAEVTARFRSEGDFNICARQFAEIYEAAIEEHCATSPDLRAEMQAVSRYLRWIVPLIKATDEVLDRTWGSPERATSFDELHTRTLLLEREVRDALGRANRDGA